MTIEAIDDIPWNVVNPEAADPYYSVRMVRLDARHEEKELVQKAVQKSLKQADFDSTVAELLPGRYARLDATTLAYKMTKRTRTHENFADIIIAAEPEYVSPIQVEAQLMVEFREALHRTDCDLLLVLSDLARKYSAGVNRQNVVAIGIAVGETFFVHVSPAVGAAIGVENISHQLFAQISQPHEDHAVMNASRSTRRISE